MLSKEEMIMNNLKNSISQKQEKQKHWQDKYQTDAFDSVSWYQKKPQFSLNLIQKYAKVDDTIIDAGAGASCLVDYLLEIGFENITLLDISKTALDITKNRINNKKIEFIVHDILEFKSAKKYQLWHDRAVFHFVRDEIEQQKYLDIVHQSLNNDGIFILATFDLKGPKECSNLEIAPYDSDKLKSILNNRFKLVDTIQEIHITPKDKEQIFNYFVLQKI
jgi:SAM-dependent methyltransferase